MLRFCLMMATALTTLIWARPAAAVPMTCTVVVNSPEAGRFELTHNDPVPSTFVLSLPEAIGGHWYPPGASEAVALDIQVGGESLQKLAPTDFAVNFAKDKATMPDQFKVRLSVDGLQSIVLEGSGVNVVTQTYMANFRWDREADHAVAQAINRGARVKVDVLKSDKRFQTEVFNGTQVELAVLDAPRQVASATIDTTAIDARRALFAQAQHLLETPLPSLCKPL